MDEWRQKKVTSTQYNPYGTNKNKTKPNENNNDGGQKSEANTRKTIEFCCSYFSNVFVILTERHASLAHFGTDGCFGFSNRNMRFETKYIEKQNKRTDTFRSPSDNFLGTWYRPIKFDVTSERSLGIFNFWTLWYREISRIVAKGYDTQVFFKLVCLRKNAWLRFEI